MTGHGKPIGEMSIEELVEEKNYYREAHGIASSSFRRYETELKRRAKVWAGFGRNGVPSRLITGAAGILNLENVTIKELLAAKRDYDNVLNEGHEGYNPFSDELDRRYTWLANVTNSLEPTHPNDL